MILRGIPFGHVLNASGARNFDGSGWWYHRLARWIGLDYRGSTFVAKTTTLSPREGNMPLADPMTPKRWLPDCIIVKPWQGVVLNAVGLSGPGAAWLLEQGVWLKQTDPFFISFMAVGDTRENRSREMHAFVRLLEKHLPFPAPCGLQINFSCPNVGLSVTSLVDEMEETLDIADGLGIPLVPKINVLFPAEAIMALHEHAALDALSVSNTIPWGKLPDKIDWEGIFGTESPLAKYGGGGLSGKPLLPIVCDHVRTLRLMGFTKPIIGGGGILSMQDARRMIDHGASAIELGSISILRPWRVRGVIRHVNARLAA